MILGIISKEIENSNPTLAGLLKKVMDKGDFLEVSKGIACHIKELSKEKERLEDLRNRIANIYN